MVGADIVIPMEMVIRRATLFDVPAILYIIRSVVPGMQALGNLQWDENYPNAEVFMRDIELKQLWVADFAGVLGGVAAITQDSSPEYAQVGWDLQEPALVIHRLAVDPEFRGHGIGTALMEEAQALAEEQGITVLRVDTSVTNRATQRLFPKLGYSLSGEISLDHRPGQKFLCFERRLPGVRVV